MRNLRLSTAKLAKDLADTAGFNAASKNLVKSLGTGHDVEDGLSLLSEFSCGGEARVRVLGGVRGRRWRWSREALTEHLRQASLTFSTLTSEKPLMFLSCLDKALFTDCIQHQQPAEGADFQLEMTDSDGMIAIVLELGDIRSVDAVALEDVQINKVMDDLLFFLAGSNRGGHGGKMFFLERCCTVRECMRT